MKYCARAMMLGLALTITLNAWGQWSSNPNQNLALSDIPGADQIQPKALALPNNTWYVSWFNNNPNDPPPQGYDAYYQMLDANGYEQFPHDGVQVALETGLSSTQDYGFAIDNLGNAILAFQDLRRDPNNPQITVAKMSPLGQPLWGPLGVSVTVGDVNSYNVPKVTVTSDGYIVVAWVSNSSVVLQKLTPNGAPVWVGPAAFNHGVMLQEPSYNYILADLHAADNGSVIVSWVRNQGFGSSNYLYANKISSSGQLLWGSGHVHVEDGASLQTTERPYFIPDGSGGAVFAWYTNTPLQSYAQHILSNGTEAFPHNGSAAATTGSDVRADPTVSYNPATQETFLFWTEEDSGQMVQGISAQKFNSAGARKWTDSGVTLVPLGADAQINPQSVQIGKGALGVWVDQQVTGNGTVEAVKLDTKGNFVCQEFPVSSALSQKARVWTAIAPSGLTTVAWQDYRFGNSGIYIQNINPDCTLGIEE